AEEVRAIEIGHIATPAPLNALGIKGVGEAGAIPVPALVAEAIDDALAPLGVRVREMPLDPDRLRRLIESARRAGREAQGRRRIPSTSVLAELVMLGANVVYGTSYVVARTTLESVPPALLAFSP